MKPNILFILIDSLRSDRCHGEKKTSRTPNLDGLIDGGALFTTSISPVASTMASLGSIFTGLIPPNTGMSDTSYRKMDSSLESYISLLAGQNYSTHAAHPMLNHILDVARGFEHNIDAVMHNNYQSLFGGLGEKVLDRLDSLKTQAPWMFYIHLSDLHSPISVPSEFDSGMYGDTAYDRMISAMDSWLGRFISRIDPNETLIVVTSDHGEYIHSVAKKDGMINLEEARLEVFLWKLGNKMPPALNYPKRKVAKILRSVRSRQRDARISKEDLTSSQRRALTATRTSPGHHMFDDTIVTPLLFVGPGVKKGKRINLQVSSVDIFPTLMQLCDIKDTLSPDGRSIIPMMDGTGSEVPAYIESMPAMEGGTKLVGVRTSEFKYFRGEDGKAELYDLRRDPGEEFNVAGDHPSTIGKMEEILQGFLAGSRTANVPMSDAERANVEAELKKLGYT